MMSNAKKSTIEVRGIAVTILSQSHDDYISLTDIARFKDHKRTDYLVSNWLRNRNTVEFLGLWESLNNPNFNPIEFDGIRSNAGLNGFILTVKRWVERTHATGIISKAGRYGGTFAHKDIAFEFASWISVEFKLYLIKEFQRLKEDESQHLSLTWNLTRTLSKLNYHIHTDAVRTYLIPRTISSIQSTFANSTEADLLNVALFGRTAKQWRESSKELTGTIRYYATIEQLIVLSNLETLNAEFIRMELAQKERIQRLNEIAIHQMEILTSIPTLRQLKK